MRIAYISFEYPLDTAVGGIATYVYQASQMMKSRGHDVEVFCASFTRNISEEFEGILVHRIVATTSEFPEKILSVFHSRHELRKFDLIESPEYSGDGYEIKRSFPELPMVVKLHTPTYFIVELNNSYISTSFKLKYIIGGIVRRQKRQRFWKWRERSQDIDYLTAKLADQIHTPSISLGDIVAKAWDIDRSRILNVPYPFSANQKFLEIPIKSERLTKTVTYLGRLEIRKGILELVKAIPLILKEIPDVRVQIVGKTAQSTVPGLSMKDYVKQELHQYLNQIDFLEATPDQIPGILAQTDVCVFPSLWENFPNVCLEAMSAGRAIVGSNQGGMYDMLNSPEAGILVNPRRPKEIAGAVIRLLKSEKLRHTLGAVARQKVLTAYSSETIGNLMEMQYAKLIK